MLGIYASAALICAASLIAGRAFFALLGSREWTWLSAPVGLALLVVVALLLVRLPGRSLTAAVVIGAVLLAALVYLVRGRAAPLALGPAARQGLPVAAILLLAGAIPFLASGRVGVLGEGLYTNDHAAQLFWTEWIRNGFGDEPGAVQVGYPVGPSSLVAAAADATGTSLETAFNGLLLAIAVLTGLAALAVASRLPALRRTAVASLVGLPYLGASFLAQSAFKETVMALFVLGLALSLRELGRRRANEAEAPSVSEAPALAAIGVLALASVFTVSIPGLAWFAAAFGVWILLEAASGRGRPSVRRALARLRPAWPILAAVAIVLAGIAATQLGAISSFVERLDVVRQTGGRLFSSVSPREVLGIWPEGDFRRNVSGRADALAATAVGLAAAALAAWWWLRRRDLAVPAVVAGGIAVYAGARWFGGIHIQAKALAVIAPVTMLFICQGLLAPRAPTRRAARRTAVAALAAWSALAVVFVAGAAASTFLALRAAPVGTSTYSDQLESLRASVQGSKVLVLVPDRFSSYGLRGSEVHSPGGYVPSRTPRARPGKEWDQGRMIDFDTVTKEVLDRMDYAITTTASYQSTPPTNFQPVRSTEAFTLWARHGPTPSREVLEKAGDPGAVLDCDTPRGRRLSRTEGSAAVTPKPVVGRPGAWRSRNSFSLDGSATQTLRLDRGTWRLSLQYHSPIGLRLEGPGFERELPASLEGMYAFAPGLGPYWPAGEIEVSGPGPVRITARPQDPSRTQRLLGVSRFSWVGGLAATRPGGIEVVSLSEACGRYVDWYRIRSRG